MCRQLFMTFSIWISIIASSGCLNVDFSFLDTPVYDSLYPNIEIPEQSDWVDHGKIISPGEEGTWDHLLWGGFGGTVVKRDSLFFLYYQGARNFSDEFGTVTYRTIGVATSSDGIHFAKYPQNPVLTWFPNEGLEEGVVSGGATTITNDGVVFYYGANSKVNDFLVNGDGRLAISKDGFEFSDAGIVLDHKENTLWGAGDEIFPIISFYDHGRWHVYYIPNGTPQSGKLGVAWGLKPNFLPNSSAALSDNKEIEAWGMGGYAKIGPDTYALFLNNVRNPGLEVRTVNLEAPAQLSAPIFTYAFDNFLQATVYLDIETEKWYMFYRTSDSDAYNVKTAPLVRIDR